ncbi:hypothetical protein B7990_00490 [Fibrobacter sp. UWB4]|uniref:hypothetical protein n=1 Tax=Fibrobacter sp. UWB4 TaxID=1964356 RepID=UPI000B523731|nr:hypothetical protein [Fibrobacter sp. UWB4]OWV19689.1 hypothetical protein B7990_00490 [Fibrobacter sp. UWB4]
MAYPYDEIYLESVQKNLGFFFQISLRNLNLLPQDVQNTFLASEVSKQIEMGNPDFLCGKSGYELALIAFPKILTDDIIKQAISEPFYPEAEYWSGTVLAYCQWKTGKSFSAILAQYPLERILSNYHLMHEADITKMVNLIEAGFNASNS